MAIGRGWCPRWTSIVLNCSRRSRFPTESSLPLRRPAAQFRFAPRSPRRAVSPSRSRFGFHPYFRLPGLPRARWEVVFPVHERLALDPNMVPTGATEPTGPLNGAVGERTWDDEYDGVDPGACFQLSGGGRTIEMHYTEGYPVAQIFAPPGTDYLCIEPMTAVANALEGPDEDLRWVPVGEQHSTTFRIACRRAAERAPARG